MIKRTGNAKIMDIGSALDLTNAAAENVYAAYAAPEMLDREEVTPRSDLASVGYVLDRLLAGRPLFAGRITRRCWKKRTLPHGCTKCCRPKFVTASS